MTCSHPGATFCRPLAAACAAVVLVAALPPIAAAEEGPGVPLATAVIAATVDLLPPVVVPVVELPALPVPAASAPLAAEPVPAEAAPSAPPQGPAVPPVVKPVPKPPAAPVSASPTQLASSAAPTADEPAPANVNVAIRIDSPGDNGAVTQSNEVVSTEGATQAPESGYHDEPAQYQEPVDSPISSEASDAGSSAPTWDWTWSCGGTSVPVSTPSLPAGSVPETWNWNWDWNCGDDAADQDNTDAKSSPQYHASAKQYHPINVNISIRIGSAGDDGPVTQTNVAVAVSVPSASAIVAATGVMPPARPGGEAGADASASPTAAEPDPVAVEDDVVRGGAPGLPPGAFDPVPARSMPQTTIEPPAVPALAERLPGLVASRVADAPRRASGARKTMRRHAPLQPERGPMLALGFAGAPTGPGGDGGSNGFLLFLFPFVFALADSARRLLRESRAPAADSPGSRRDKPG